MTSFVTTQSSTFRTAFDPHSLKAPSFRYSLETLRWPSSKEGGEGGRGTLDVFIADVFIAEYCSMACCYRMIVDLMQRVCGIASSKF